MISARPLIAVVDDEESVRAAMKRLMRSSGLNVETYRSGIEFLTALEFLQPDCVVLDLHMPQVSGFEVQSRLKQSDKRIPVVVITGHDTPESRDRVMKLGATAYLLKPVDDVTLLEAIASAIPGCKL